MSVEEVAVGAEAMTTQQQRRKQQQQREEKIRTVLKCYSQWHNYDLAGLSAEYLQTSGLPVVGVEK
jgi:hypothetical protein